MRCKLCFLLVVISVVLSCKRSSGISAILEEMRSKRIETQFEKMSCYRNGEDTVGYVPKYHKYLLIVNIDSTGCTPCSVSHLSQWREWIELSEKSEGHFKLVFVYHPRKNEIDEVVRSMKYYSQVYKDTPLYLDKRGLFLKRNFNISMPDDMQTFLVNKADSIVFVGNPVYNINVKKELIKITNL